MDVLGDRKEVGRRIAAARGYAGLGLGALAKELGISEPTLRSYEEGSLGGYARTRETRQALLEEVRGITEAPPQILGLAEGEADIRSRLERVEEILGVLAATKGEEQVAPPSGSESQPRNGKAAGGSSNG